MNIKTTIGKWAAVLALSAGLITGCKKQDDDTSGASGKAQLTMRLTDGPASYDAVYLDVQQVQIITTANGTLTLTPFRTGIYDLLKLSNGIDTLLLSADIPAGTISQIRLILGNNNSVVVDGTTHSLNTPSAQESGLKLNIHETLQAGGAYTIWLDFDAGKSIHQTGNGQYKLKPVIRAYTAQTNGRIKGYVLPLAALTTVYAINGTDTFSAIPAPVTGFYQISGLPAGTYKVWYDASLATYQDLTVNNVQVTYGSSTDLGITTLTP
jgi:hypothetical protein